MDRLAELLRLLPLADWAALSFFFIAWVGYAAVTSRMNGWSALRVSTMTSLPAIAVILAAWFVADALGAVRIDAAALPGVSWRLAYLALCGVVLAMFLWNAGAQRTGAVNATLLLNLMPVVTFATRALEGARFVPSELIGAGIVVGALVANNLLLRRAAALQASPADAVPLVSPGAPSQHG